MTDVRSVVFTGLRHLHVWVYDIKYVSKYLTITLLSVPQRLFVEGTWAMLTSTTHTIDSCLEALCENHSSFVEQTKEG